MKYTVIIAIIVNNMIANAQLFTIENIHNFMPYNKNYFKKELKAQGANFISVEPPENKSDGLTVFIEGGSVWYIYQNDKCIKIMINMDDNREGNILCNVYYKFINEHGNKMVDGSWLLSNDNIHYKVEFEYDEKGNTNQRSYIIEHF